MHTELSTKEIEASKGSSRLCWRIMRSRSNKRKASALLVVYMCSVPLTTTGMPRARWALVLPRAEARGRCPKSAPAAP